MPPLTAKLAATEYAPSIENVNPGFMATVLVQDWLPLQTAKLPPLATWMLPLPVM